MMDIEKILNDFGVRKSGRSIKSMYQLMSTEFKIADENREVLQKMFPNIESNSSMWDLIKDAVHFSKKLLTKKEYFKDFRRKCFKLDLNSGNWEVNQVIKNIDNFFKKQNINLTFNEYVKTCLKYKKKPVNRFDYYTTAYLLLDMIGYKADDLPKPTDNMQNIQNDAEHSFYSAYCDYFVSTDKKLIIKTKVLFNEFNIPTTVISPKELIETVKNKIHIIDKNKHFVNEAFGLIKNENIEEIDEETQVSAFLFKLPIFHFNFFNYAIFQNYEEENTFVLTFIKVFKNYSDFLYYTEVERLLDRVCNFFGYENNQEYVDKKNKFIHGDEVTVFMWDFEVCNIQLEKDIETNMPILTYIVLTNEK